MADQRIGHWRCDGLTMRRSDGALVTYLGPADDRSVINATKLRFGLRHVGQDLVIDVEQKVSGRDGLGRSLFYAFPISDLGDDAWVSEEMRRLLVDALFSWPVGVFAPTHPSGVTASRKYQEEGLEFFETPPSVLDPASIEDEPVSAEAFEWTLEVGDGSGPAPDPRKALKDERHGRLRYLDAALRHGLLMKSRQCIIAIPRTKPGRESPAILYIDKHLATDCYRLARYDTGWALMGGGPVGAWDPKTGNPLRRRRKSSNPLKQAIGSFFYDIADRKEDRDRMRYGRSRVARTPLDVATSRRIAGRIEDALGALMSNHPEHGPSGLTMPSPTAIAGKASGKLLMVKRGEKVEGLQQMREYSDARLYSGGITSTPPPSAKVDMTECMVTGPDGDTLAFEGSGDELGLLPMTVRFRCRAASLDWPVIARRIDSVPSSQYDYRHGLRSRWRIDHVESLSIWKREGKSLPEDQEWHRMRRFLEDSLLCLPDSVKTGPMPLTIEMIGGYHDGQWHGEGLRRVSTRQLDLKDAPRVVVAWRQDTSRSDWRQMSYTPTPAAERAGYSADFPAFEKADSHGNRLINAGYYTDHDMRGEFMGYVPMCDLEWNGRRFRMRGEATNILASSLHEVDWDAAAPDGDHVRKSNFTKDTVIDLELWRQLRDASEAGIGHGQSVRLNGAFVFDLWRPGVSRLVSLSDNADLKP